MSRLQNVLISAVLALAGCGIGSVNATLGDADTSFNPDLLGAWQSPDSSEAAVITADGKGGYLIVYDEQGSKPGRFLARSGLIAGRRVLDVQPDASAAAGNDSYKALLLPLHTVLFLDSVGREVHFSGLDPDSVTAILEREPNAVAHIKVDDANILTAPTPAVQKFIAGLAARPGVLQPPTVWVRRTASAPN
ncbi:MAG TPA: hypothetical protein VF021_11765 [Longimicrobiales bacterium]